MGLLGKAIAINNAHTGSVSSKEDVTSKEGDASESPASGSSASLGVQSFIASFHRKNPHFHAVVLQGIGGDINSMIACHGGAVVDLPGGNTLVLLPGALDRELFAHRLCHSAGLPILSQLSADASFLALETLSPYLQ